MTPDTLSALIDRCHAGAQAKGFWDVTPNPGQQLMLAIGELAEAQEADRKDCRLRFPALLDQLSDCSETAAFATVFAAQVKDTVEDELADAYIRLCDFAGGFGLDLAQINVMKCDPEQWVIATDNFGDALLTCVDAVMDMHKVRLRTGFAPGHMEGPLSDALTWIEVLARQQGIDLARHIDLKLRYNATRPFKHNKAY